MAEPSLEFSLARLAKSLDRLESAAAAAHAREANGEARHRRLRERTQAALASLEELIVAAEAR